MADRNRPVAPTAALRNLRSARGAAALLRQIPGLSPAVAREIWVALRAITAGTRAFTLRVLRKAGRRLGHAVPPLPVRVPRTTDRTDPAWYRTRARGGSVRLELLRAFKRLAVAELPLLEAHLGRRESSLFRLRPKPARFPRVVPAVEFRRAARRWLHLMTGKATWLSLRLAEIAVTATGNPAGAVETLRVCADVSASPQLYDPFNTFAAFLEAFHRLAAQRGALAGLLDDSSGRSAFRRIALAGPGKGWWHSKRARLIVRACQPPAH